MPETISQMTAILTSACFVIVALCRDAQEYLHIEVRPVIIHVAVWYNIIVLRGRVTADLRYKRTMGIREHLSIEQCNMRLTAKN